MDGVMIKNQTSDNQRILLLSAKGVEEIQTLVAIVSLGLCRALASGVIGPTYACARLFGPALLTRMESLGSLAELREAVHLATELEDVSELVPHALQESIQEIEAKLVSAIGSLAAESTDGEKWLVPDAAMNNEVKNRNQVE